MPNYANPLYANGVPTYSNEVGALGEVFKALAPNPLRDLQIQGYASNARLHQLQGDVIQNQQTGLADVANNLQTGNYQGVLPGMIRSGNLQYIDNVAKAVPSQYSFQALDPNFTPGPDFDSRLARVVGGTGGDVGHTMYGFTKTADEIARNNNMVSADRRRGDDLQLSGVMAGVGENRRFHDLTANEDIRYHNLADATNRRDSDLRTSVGMAGVSEDARNHTLQDARAGEKNTFDLNVGMNKNTLGYQGVVYKADRDKEAKQFDTLNDQRKSTPGGAVMDPSKFDDALIQTLPGSTQDDKGWMVNPSVAPADLAEVRTRAAAYFRQDPRDPYGAIQRANAEVFGQAPSITPAQAPWLSSNTPEQVNTLPADQRPPLPNLAQQFVAPPPAAPMPVPGAGPAAAPPADATLAKAAATAKVPGANRQGIVQKLMSLGYTAQQIQQAGI